MKKCMNQHFTYITLNILMTGLNKSCAIPNIHKMITKQPMVTVIGETILNINIFCYAMVNSLCYTRCK